MALLTSPVSFFFSYIIFLPQVIFPIESKYFSFNSIIFFFHITFKIAWVVHGVFLARVCELDTTINIYILSVILMPGCSILKCYHFRRVLQLENYLVLVISLNLFLLKIGMNTLISLVDCIGTLMQSTGPEVFNESAFTDVLNMLNRNAWPKAVLGLRMLLLPFC